MRQVVANLIDNAGGVDGRLHDPAAARSTRTESDGDAVEIEVSDSGHGISPEDKEKLFLPHFRPKERGTGLGLAIASRIIAEHNGTIHVEDNLPAGSEIRDSVPGGGSGCGGINNRDIVVARKFQRVSRPRVQVSGRWRKRTDCR